MYGPLLLSYFFFFFNVTAPTEIYTLSLHDALPIGVCKRPDSSRRLLDDRQEVSAGERTRRLKVCATNWRRASPLISLRDMEGSEESGARRQNARWAIESNGLANTTRTKFSLRAV